MIENNSYTKLLRTIKWIELKDSGLVYREQVSSLGRQLHNYM